MNFWQHNTDMNRHVELYKKYMAFHEVMLEEYEPLEIAAVISVQALSFYKTVLPDEDYQKIVDAISDRRDLIQTFDGPNIV
jgi:hypothetical protein